MLAQPGLSPLVAVAISLRVFIPSPIVTYAPLDVSPLQRTFSGGDKATLHAAIELAVTGSAALRLTFRDFHPTREYRNEDSRRVAGRPDWYRTLASGARPIDSGDAPATDATLNVSWRVPSGGTHGALLKVDGANPLVSGAPAIDAEILVGLRERNGVVEYMLQGAHDGFPSYEIKLNQATVYSHDCIPNDTPTDLWPPMDVSITRAWQRL